MRVLSFLVFAVSREGSVHGPVEVAPADVHEQLEQYRRQGCDAFAVIGTAEEAEHPDSQADGVKEPESIDAGSAPAETTEQCG